MADQTFDSRLEVLLRSALAREVASLPVSVTADQVLERANQRRGGGLAGRLRQSGQYARRQRLSFAAGAGGAVVVIVVAAALGLSFFKNQKPIIGPSVRATPTGSPAPSASARPTATATTTQEAATVAPPGLRRNGENIVFDWSQLGWDLAAKDPETGTTRSLVDAGGIRDCTGTGHCANFVKTAQWSPDGRWVAFEVSFGSLDEMPRGPCGPTAGLWVQGTTGQPRQLTTPCAATSSAEDIEELWTWSPDGARLAYARIDGDDNGLFLIDPSDGRRTLLVDPGGDPNSPGNHGPSSSTLLGWSPDGTRLAYAVEGSVYEVLVETGERSLLAESFDDVEDIRYSPDGKQIALLEGPRIQVMDADGSHRQTLFEGDADFIEWSPNGDRILYQLSVGNTSMFGWDSEVWTVAPDGTHRIKVFDSDGCSMSRSQGDALPVWAPNGTQISYNDCGEWVVSNADGTGEPQPLGVLVHKSWAGGGLSGWDTVLPVP